MAVDKSLYYYDESQVDPEADDIDVQMDLPGMEMDSSDVTYLEDGSAIIGGEDEEGELPPIDQTPHGANLVAYFDDDELDEMAENLIEAWKQDNEDRAEWREIYKKGLDLLGMQIEERDEPFQGASGVHHPLLAEACVQFQAQAYKELLPSNGPVLTKVLGDETPDRLQQAARVKDFMNYQIMDVMEEFDDDLDQLLLYLPLGGSAFKKTYFDPIKGRSCSEFIKADNITVPYKSKNLATTPRLVHDFYMDGNTLLKYQDTGFYADSHMAKPIQQRELSDAEEKEYELHGIENNSSYFDFDEEYHILEGHVDLDHELLNDGNIVRPYVITIDKESSTVLAIRRNWAESNQKKDKLAYFTHYKFLPGLGFYGFGLIHMIGGLTTSATSILRQLIDSGTFSNLPGGLKARGMRVEGDGDPIAPGEWRDVDVAGGTIRDSLMALPYKEPSAVLFQLLGALVESGQRFASIADMNVGDVSGSQQQPVGTTVAMLERGTKVMSAIHKRLHRSQKHEFKILARVIRDNLTESGYPYAVQGANKMIMKQDFDDRVDILPVSDPNIFSMAQRVMLASQQLQMAQAAPQVHNVREAYRRMYAAMGISDIESILKAEQKPQAISPLMEHRKVFMNQKLEPVQGMDHEAHIQAHLTLLKHPSVSSNVEFTANLIQDIMGHISFIAKQQLMQQQPQMPQGQMPQGQQQKAPDSSRLELQLFQQLLPQMMPPPQEDRMAQLQERQLDITERFNEGKLTNEEFKQKLDAIMEMAKIASNEKQTEAKLNTDIEDTVLNAQIDFIKAMSNGNGNT